MTDEPTLFDTVAEDLDALYGPGQARRVDPPTSKLAAKMVRARATTARVRLLEAFLRNSPLTDEEAAVLAGLSLHSEYATRCSELRRGDLIRVTGGTRQGRSGSQREVSEITEAGIAVMRQREAS